MSAIDFSAQWAAVIAYLGTSSNATNLAALSPRPPVVKGQPEQWEEKIAPWLIIVDMLGSDQQRDAASANNIHQTWGTGFRVYVAAKAATADLADTAVLSVVSAICNDLAGSGGYVDTARTTLIRAVGDRWSWDPLGQDNTISMAFVDITGIFYRN